MLLVPLLTGCAKVNTELTINDNKSAQFETTISYDGDLRTPQNDYAQYFIDNYNKFFGKDYQITTKFNEKDSTIKAEKSITNLTKEDFNLAPLGFSSNLKSGKFIEIKKNFLISSYNINMTYNYPHQKEIFTKLVKASKEQQNVSEQDFTPEYYIKYGDPSVLEFPKAPATTEDNVPKENSENENQIINTDFTIKLPAFASYNNADIQKANIYTWHIKDNEPTEIKLQYVRYSGFAIFFILLVGVGLLVLLAKRLLRHESQKRMDNIKNIV